MSFLPDDKVRFAIEHPAHRGQYLVLGIPSGRKRPALWLQQRVGEPIILAQFHGDPHAEQTFKFLSDLINTINEIHDAHESENEGPRDQQGGGEPGDESESEPG